jgi:hypothetical protein
VRRAAREALGVIQVRDARAAARVARGR